MPGARYEACRMQLAARATNKALSLCQPYQRTVLAPAGSFPDAGMKQFWDLGPLEGAVSLGQGAAIGTIYLQKPDGTPWRLGVPLAVMSLRVPAATSQVSNFVPAPEQADSLTFMFRMAGAAIGGLPPGTRGEESKRRAAGVRVQCYRGCWASGCPTKAARWGCGDAGGGLLAHHHLVRYSELGVLHA